MASYVDLIRQDVHIHELTEDASSLPSSILQFVQFLKNGFKIPRWLKSGPVPFTDRRATDLLHQLRASDGASNFDLWDSSDEIIDKEIEQRLHVVFKNALLDCARIRSVVETEYLTDTPYPKESFLVILLRNIIYDAHEQLSVLEGVPVVFPRHFGGEPIPILSYMTKSFYVPFVVSVCQEMPTPQHAEEIEANDEQQEEDSSEESELFKHPPPTMSEFLEACEPKTREEVEEEPEEQVLQPQFDAYFFAFPSSATPPSNCHIPVLFMADEAQLPVFMSSLLYQRRVWHINDPLIGLEFSKYDTVIRLFLGWLDDDVSSERVLPRVHLLELETPVVLDLSSPAVALALSRLLLSLDAHISATRDSARHSVDVVFSETQTCSPLSWRIDTDDREEEIAAAEDEDVRDMILQWTENQWYSASEVIRPLNNLTSFPTDRSGEEGDGLLDSEPDVPNWGPTYVSSPSSHSCSKFAATSGEDDYRVFRWMFDRRVAPLSLPCDVAFCDEYEEMTGFIWPETWSAREDLPSVDAALEPSVQELLKRVTALKARQNAVKCISVAEFSVDLAMLEQHFSAILQVARIGSEKKAFRENVYEVNWRHDHDRLLFDFFVRFVQPMVDGRVISCREDPFSRPILETTLRLPMNENMDRGQQKRLQILIMNLLHRRNPDLENWMQTRGRSWDDALEESAQSLDPISRWSRWWRETDAETDHRRILKLNQTPSTGRCDTLGRLVVELPVMSPEQLTRLFPLIARQEWNDAGIVRGKSCSNPTLSIPPMKPEEATAGLVGQTQTLTDEAQRTQIRPDALRLELPILALQYTMGSDSDLKVANHIRMFLTASVKFLQAVGITNVPMYGIEANGPVAIVAAAVLRDENFVDLFERVIERSDISTPLGAWHYATILCRLAQKHARIIEQKFDDVKETLSASLLQEDSLLGSWMIGHQKAALKAQENGTSLEKNFEPKSS